MIRRGIKKTVYFHSHRYDNGEEYFHARSHKSEKTHDLAHHQHEHKKAFPFRALIVGLIHGMAGSAALILLTLNTVTSPLIGILYILLFGTGSIIGMAILSAVITVPLRYTANTLSWLHYFFYFAIGITSIFLGSSLVYENSFMI